MTDRRRGAIYAPFKFALYLASLGYAAAIWARALLYKFRIFKSVKVPLKVVSVGNLTLGGTGKTPFTVMLAGILKGEMRKEVCVLIRGYGWDEQNLLKKKLEDMPILVGEDRARSARRAIRLYGSNTAVLDDGFQHWELERDLDIVLIDSRDPFGNGHLFPRGILREAKAALRRADMIVFTKVNKKRVDIEALKNDLKRIKGSLVFVEAVHEPRSLYSVRERKEHKLSFAAGKRVVLLSSIGDPSYFEDTVRDLGADIVEHITFGDHHNYSERDARRVKEKLKMRSFDFLMTTEKDEVKLARMCITFGDYQVMKLAVELKITEGRELLIDRLRGVYSR